MKRRRLELRRQPQPNNHKKGIVTVWLFLFCDYFCKAKPARDLGDKSMIIKELEQLEFSDRFEQAGYRAESQLAFYLKREFKDDPQFLVFNNLRLSKSGDICQIDHLVLHRYGIIIIESKSVTTRVEVNELGEWKRWFNNNWQGMPSPILQAQRQGKFLKDYLEDNVETLLNKNLLGKQVHFIRMPMDVLVAISDSGIINRPKNDKLEQVCKADQISEKIKKIATNYRKKDSLFNLSLEIIYEFNSDEIQRISQFLLEQHQSVSPSVSTTSQNTQPQVSSIPTTKNTVISSNNKPKPLDSVPKAVVKPIASNIPQNTCPHCHSKNLSILYVRSYFFKCNDCGKNIAIKNICPTCGDREKTRKQGLEFFTECEKCNTSRLLHTNSSS